MEALRQQRPGRQAQQRQPRTDHIVKITRAVNGATGRATYMVVEVGNPEAPVVVYDEIGADPCDAPSNVAEHLAGFYSRLRTEAV